MQIDTEEENQKLLKKINLLENEITKLHEALENSKKFINIEATKVPIKLYIVGKYNGFIKEKGLLCISIEGRENYYTLDSYGSARLPFPDARVLIFNKEGSTNTPCIIGFNKGRMIELAPTYIAKLNSVNFVQAEIFASINEHKNISLKISEDFLKKFSIKANEEIVVRKIQIATEFFFVPVTNIQKNRNTSDELYSFLANKL